MDDSGGDEGNDKKVDDNSSGGINAQALFASVFIPFVPMLSLLIGVYIYSQSPTILSSQNCAQSYGRSNQDDRLL